MISGAADAVVPAHDVATVCGLLAKCSHVEIAGAEHNLLLTHPTYIADALRSFILVEPSAKLADTQNRAASGRS